MTHAAVGAKTTPVLRFAPSPNGFLHLGHAYSALLNAALAQRLGGRLLLRIEDIDPTRCRPEFERAIYEDLAWLGFAWEEPVRRQSDHMDDYGAALAKLREMGLVYPCFASRQEIRAAIVERERAGAAIDPDGAVPVHEDVGHGRIAGERGERAEDAPRDAARGPVGARDEGFHPMTLARGVIARGGDGAPRWRSVRKTSPGRTRFVPRLVSRNQVCVPLGCGAPPRVARADPRNRLRRPNRT